MRAHLTDTKYGHKKKKLICTSISHTKTSTTCIIIHFRLKRFYGIEKQIFNEYILFSIHL